MTSIGVNIGDNFYNLEAPAPDENARQAAPSSVYWTRIWPSAIALSRFIVDQPQIFAGKSVIELGAGLGLPSLVASSFARSVTCSDKEARAVEWMQKNFMNNPVISARQLDWNNIPENTEAEIWMMSDVNYDASSFEALENLFKRILNKGSTVVLSTPHRLQGKPFVSQVLHYCSFKQEYEIDAEGKGRMISVLVLEN